MSPQKCNYCFIGFFLFNNGSCITECPQRYYRDQIINTCQRCSYDCLTCSGLYVCDSCSPDVDFRQLDNVTLKCVPITGYYDINLTVCIKCPSNCFSCLNPSYCTQCSTGYYLNNNTCIANCPARFYTENNSLTCQGCPIDCLYCDKNNNCLDCSLTNDYRLISPKLQRCSAIIGRYDDFTQIAKPCPTGCSMCTAKNFCTACYSSYFLDAFHNCVTSCPPRTLA